MFFFFNFCFILMIVMKMADFKLPEVLHLGTGSRVFRIRKRENVKVEVGEKTQSEDEK